MAKLEIDNIPLQLRQCDQWALWRYEPGKDGKQTKVPYQPNGKRASSTDILTWSTFKLCVLEILVDKPIYDGLFYVLCADDPFTVVDFDHCINAYGEIDEQIIKWCKELNSYTEVSPSEEGLHVWVEAQPPGDRNRRAGVDIEFYSTARFMSVTGWMVEGSMKTIEPHQTELKALYDGVFDGINDGVNHTKLTPITVEYEPGVSFSDGEIIEKCMKAANGAKFRLLFAHGDISAYGDDESAADMALMNMIAFFCDNDAEQMERIFGMSALADRPKWKRADYRQRTIQKAINRPQIDIKTVDDTELGDHVKVTITQEEKDQINRKAYDLLKNGNLMELWLDTFAQFHFGDKGIGEGILLSTVIQSVANALGLQIKVTGQSGRGKTHAARTAMHLLPQKFVQYATFSDAALWYKEGLLAGSTIFSDDVNLSDAQEAMIRRASSRWQVATPRDVLQQKGKGWENSEQMLPPRLNWLLTSVQHEGTDQLMNRQLAYEVDEGSDKEYVDFALNKLKKADDEFPVNENVCIIREAIRIIKETNDGELRLERVVIPFADEIEWNDIGNRRNLYMFSDLMFGFTMMNFLQREKDADGNYVATKEDFKHAMHHYHRLAEGQQMHIPSGPARNMVQYFQDQEAYDEYTGLSVNKIKDDMHISAQRVGQIIKELFETQSRFNEETITESEVDGDLGGVRRGRKKKIYWLSEKILNLQEAGAVVSLKDKGDKRK